MARHGASSDPEIVEIIDFLKVHPEITLPDSPFIPYDFAIGAPSFTKAVCGPDETGFRYVVHNGRKVYYPKDMDPFEIGLTYRGAVVEQDVRSPHRYLEGLATVDEGDVVALVGASDGIFCLSMIERVSRAHLFEPEQRWMEPLALTLKPWADKIEIVNRFVGAKTEDRTVGLDEYFAGKTEPNFIQIDTEGAESAILSGAMGILQRSTKIRLSVCTYHRDGDFAEFTQFFKRLGFDVAASHGYFIFGLRDPFIRRALIHAARNGAKSAG